MNLSTIQTKSGKFAIAAFDHRSSLVTAFGLAPESASAAEALTFFKTSCMEAFSSLASGVLIDPVYGFPSLDHKAPAAGVIFALEQSGYTADPVAVPTLIPNWSVEAVRHNYGVAKMLVQYHPQQTTAGEKKRLLAEIHSTCQYHHIAFVLEPLIVHPDGKTALSPGEFQEAQLAAVRELQPLCDVLKLQYPGDALSSATLTAEIDIPWILLSKGMPYDAFLHATKVALENGAAGFAVGRSLWQEVTTFRTGDGQVEWPKVVEFLHTTARDRFATLCDLLR